MLDLVNVRAPEEIETTLADLVLTGDQEGEIQKIVKAIEHREYLASIGLREIGKLLFVGPPGTGKTTVSRALAHELGIPLVEVKMSMITSQYLGETAKNVEKTFEVAKRLSPCILFIDEFDSVAKTRRSDEHAALKRAVNTPPRSTRCRSCATRSFDRRDQPPGPTRRGRVAPLRRDRQLPQAGP